MYLKPMERGTDSMGSGAYGASRGSRTHKGVDLCAIPNQIVCSHVNGHVTKIGRPYAPNNNSDKDVLKSALRYVQVTDHSGVAHRFFYVKPSVEIGQNVYTGSELGIVSDLNEIWPTMKNHVHYEVKVGGFHVNPDEYL